MRILNTTNVFIHWILMLIGFLLNMIPPVFLLRDRNRVPLKKELPGVFIFSFLAVHFGFMSIELPVVGGDFRRLPFVTRVIHLLLVLSGLFVTSACFSDGVKKLPDQPDIVKESGWTLFFGLLSLHFLTMLPRFV